MVGFGNKGDKVAKQYGGIIRIHKISYKIRWGYSEWIITQTSKQAAVK